MSAALEKLSLRAQKCKESFTESDVSDFYASANIGFWPNESKCILLKLDDELVNIASDSLGNIIVKGYNFSPTEKMLLLRDVFEVSPPQVSTMLDFFTDREGEPVSADVFTDFVRKKMWNKSQIARNNDGLFAYRVITLLNGDSSKLYILLSADFDTDKVRLTVLLPAKTVIAKTFFVNDDKVLSVKQTFNGKRLMEWSPNRLCKFFHNNDFPNDGELSKLSFDDVKVAISLFEK